MGRKTYAALKINKWISYSLLWSFKSYLLNVPWPINVYRYTISLVSNLLSISSAVIASLLFISIIASFLGSNLYHHSILLPDSSSINYIKNINMRLAPFIITILALFVRWIRVKVRRGVPSSPSILQLSNHRALLLSRIDSQLFASGYIQ